MQCSHSEGRLSLLLTPRFVPLGLITPCSFLLLWLIFTHSAIPTVPVLCARSYAGNAPISKSSRSEGSQRVMETEQEVTTPNVYYVEAGNRNE